ncbi:MAG: AbgT family transporter [Candidatus Eisenbacteria bacterium]|nr:AbgT family transporter [Candidatus Eisenbacteria bacterium]
MNSESAPAAAPRRRFSPLDAIERIGNRLPHPATLFVLFAVVTLLASWLAAKLGVQVANPKDGSVIAAVNLLDREGIRRTFVDAVRNFTGFAPLGTVLVAMLGIGIAEGTGLIGVTLRALVLSVPRRWLTLTLMFAAVNGAMAADAGIIVLPPIAAMLFAASGRHPLAGIAAAFAGVAGGFGACVLPTSLDVLLSGFSQAALDASRLLPGYHVQILGNWYFMAAASPLLAIVGTVITEKLIEPRLGPWRSEAPQELAALSGEERRGLAFALAALAGTAALALVLTLPAGAPLREAAGASTIERIRPFLDSMVVWVLLLFFVPGLAYGIATRRVRNDHDVAKITTDTMASMGAYIVLAFVAAQFLNYFSRSNLGAIIAVNGANLLKGFGLEGAPLIFGLVALAAGINLFLTSSSALWGIMGPIFVPMFVLLGLTPEATQAIYRIGESSTNIVTPLMVYMPFILSYMNRYDEKAGTGTVISLMVPYTIAFLIAWTLLMLCFHAFGWPIGPGVGITLPR